MAECTRKLIGSVLWLWLAASAAACSNRINVQCEQDANCNLAASGVCTSAVTGNQWCAYPDLGCPTGYRYSDLDVGDGVGGQCVDSITDAGVPGSEFTVRVVVGGSGIGTVTSAPPGIDCSTGMTGTCVHVFARGTEVQLSANATSDSFLGWLEDCSGADVCQLETVENKEVRAIFGVRGAPLWVHQISGPGRDTGTDLVADSDGNLVAVGKFTGTVSVGGTSLTSTGGTDLYIAKLSPSTGLALWAKRFGGIGDDEAVTVALDEFNNIFVAGNFQSAVNFGGSTLNSAGSNDVFVLKLSGVGDHQWSRAVGGTSFDSAGSIATGGGAISVVGSFRDSMLLGASTVTSASAGVNDIFVAKLSGADGAVLWGKGFGGIESDSALGSVVDAMGNVVVTGVFSHTVNFGGGPRTSAGYSDVFLATFASADGAHLFSKRFGSTSIDAGLDLASNAAGEIYLVGYFEGTVDFGGATPLVASVGRDVFLAAYSQAGAHLFSKSFGGTGDEIARTIDINAGGDIAVAGQFCGTLSLGGAPLSSASGCATPDAFAVRFRGDTSTHINSVRLGGAGYETAAGVAQTNDGRFYITGEFSGFAEFGAQALTAQGSYDGYLVGLEAL